MGQHGNGCCSGTTLLSFLVGGLVGAGVALLVAPKTGEATCRLTRELSKDTKAKAEGWIEKLKIEHRARKEACETEKQG